MFIVASLFAIFLGSGLVLGRMLWLWVVKGGGLVLGKQVTRADHPWAFRLGAAAIAAGALVCLAIAAEIAWLLVQ